MKREELIKLIKERKSFLCVGLDSDYELIPRFLKDLKRCEQDSIFCFNQRIIDATAQFCVAYKLNLAFYEKYGAQGLRAFERTIQYLNLNYRKHFIIADAKRGDIGNTSAAYAKGIFNEMGADAITVAPYMGEDSVKPFLEIEDKWTILLALTSNQGSNDFQMIKDENGVELYKRVIQTSKEWGTPENMMYVVGATKAGDLTGIREIIPDHFLLVPGIGAQGGSFEQVCLFGITKDCGLLINSSRDIIFAGKGEDCAQQAAYQAQKLQQKMEKALYDYGII